MKQFFALCLVAGVLLSSCGTTRGLSGDPGATLAGASIGGHLGSAIGGLIGEGNNGPRGAFRGSSIGSIIGTIAGAAIANAATAPRNEEGSYAVQRTPQSPQRYESAQPYSAAVDGLRIRNIRFIDDSRNHIISSGESSKVIFEIVNEGRQVARHVIPVVSEATGMKRIYISPSVVVEQIAPGDGVKYTANIRAGKRIKSGHITLHLAVADEYGREYDWQEFDISTAR
ncbi:MAG: glycine zipper family protein [Bacteroides sp.]|nr:glycine zipper family protein [Bacteroides sp.]